jgi:hypothetical protein
VTTFPSSAVAVKRWLVQVCCYRSCDRGDSAAVLAAFREHQSSTILIDESDRAALSFWAIAVRSPVVD